MKAEKRKKNAPKELTRLKQALSLDKKRDADMADLQDIATVVPAEKIKKQTDVEMAGEEEDGGEWMNAYFDILCRLLLLKSSYSFIFRWEDGHG